MEKKEGQFPEQEAPQKNTDRAFVQVDNDGSPSWPQKEDEESGEREDTGRDEQAGPPRH